MPRRKINYTLGFIFDRTYRSVLLVHKKKPEWQCNKLNGVGGKVERGETLAACISRETREEVCLDIDEAFWVPLGTIVRTKERDRGSVAIFGAQFMGNKRTARRGDHEKIGWYRVGALPTNVLSNAHWLIPLARETLQQADDTFVQITALYR
jgi:ADP-ribose pyrophosphatase YjhB (NUDIX family)